VGMACRGMYVPNLYVVSCRSNRRFLDSVNQFDNAKMRRDLDMEQPIPMLKSSIDMTRSLYQLRIL